MRLVNHRGRSGLDIAGRFVDLEEHSGGRFSSDPMSTFGDWDAIRSFASEQTATGGCPLVDDRNIGRSCAESGASLCHRPQLQGSRRGGEPADPGNADGLY